MLCKVCSVEKEIEAFKRLRGKFIQPCRACWAVRMRKWRQENYLHVRESRVEWEKNNLEKIRDYSRKAYHKNKHIIRAKIKADRLVNPHKYRRVERLQEKRLWETRPFAFKARKATGKVTAAWFEAQWEKQRGRCGLTGRQMELRTCEIDHIVPRSKEGSNHPGNLRLVTPEANLLKNRLLDVELVDLCRDVIHTLANSE